MDQNPANTTLLAGTGPSPGIKPTGLVIYLCAFITGATSLSVSGRRNAFEPNSE